MKFKATIYSIVLFCVSLFYIPTTSAQQEADNWIFGWGEKVNFSTGEPIRDPSYLPLSTEYGSTSLSDSLGNLLFYSNGIDLYNRNNTIMPGSIGLMASGYATNPCIAFPKPGDHGKYYLFTVGGHGWDTDRPGAEYSIIDMNLDGGMGDIVPGQLNISLLAADSTYETIQAVRHGSRDAYWVILRNHRSPNKFLTFLVDASGVNQTPVVSSCILYFRPGGNQSEIMKVSADGKYLLYADRNGTAGHPGMVELYRFNNITGQLTTALLFNSGGNNFGAEFSANSSFLYMSNGTFIPTLVKYSNWESQFDMSKVDDLVQFNNTVFKMAIDTCIFPHGNLLLANNGRIYFVSHRDSESDLYAYLSEIQNPSVQGSGCNLNMEVLELGFVFEGLPTFVSSFMVEFDWTGSCAGDSVKFSSRFYPAPVSYNWDFNDPGSGSANTSTDQNPAHVFATTGEYEVSVTVVFPNGTNQTSVRTVNVFELPQFDLGDTIRICAGATANLSPGEGFAGYIWNTGSTNSSIEVNDPGLYWVKVKNMGDCEFTDSVWVVHYPEIVLIGDPPTVSPTTCGGQTGAITGLDFSGSPPYNIQWENLISGEVLGNQPDLYNLSVGLYQISLTDANSCEMNPVTFEIKDVGSLLIDTVTYTQSSCSVNDAEINVIAVSGLESRIQYFIKHGSDTLVQWHNGIFTGLGPGVYYAWASDSSGCSCVYNYPVIITSPDGPETSDPIVLPATPGQSDGSIILTATSATSDTLYYNVNGITQINNGYFDNLPADNYPCTVTDENGCSTVLMITVTTLNVQYLQALAGDTATCLGQAARTPLNVSNFINVRSFETTLTYDASIMDCIGYSGVNDSLVGSILPIDYPATGKVTIAWSGTHVLNLPDNSLLLNLVFKSKLPGSSTLNWDIAPGVNHFYDNNGLEILVSYEMGSVIVNNPPVINLQDHKLCEGGDYTYQPAVSGGTGNLEFNWKSPSGYSNSQPALTINQLSQNDNGEYTLRVADELNCADTATMQIHVVPLPVSGFLSDTIQFENQYWLEAAQGYAHYLWNNGDTTYRISVSDEGLYSVIIKTHEGCINADSAMMLKLSFMFGMPTAFTPDNNGLNDVFRPVFTKEGISALSLTVYNKWGQIVYNSVDINEGWDGSYNGQASPAGTYIWKVVYRTVTGRTEELSGNVILLK